MVVSADDRSSADRFKKRPTNLAALKALDASRRCDPLGQPWSQEPFGGYRQPCCMAWLLMRNWGTVPP